MEGDFSQRMGFVPITPEVQLDDINQELRTAIWNVLLRCYLNGYAPKAGRTYRGVHGSNRQTFAMNYYAHLQKRPVDELPSEWSKFVLVLRNNFFHEMPWHRVYSFIEFVIQEGGDKYRQTLLAQFNGALEREGSGFRLVGGFVTAITSSDELQSIQDAMSKAGAYRGIGEHLSAAVRMLSDKQNPDYRNSIKESISAVESLAKQITGNPHATLGSALSELEKHHKLHSAFKSAFSSLYGWTSNADGIRHALMDISDLTHADARFMLITCSAFINFAVDSTKE
jgi:hypothetical protein